MPVRESLRSLFGAPAPARLDDPALSATLPLPRGPHRTHAAAVTASAARVIPSTARASGRSRQKWQADAWTYRDAVPEVRYAHNFLGNASAQVRMFAAELGRDGEEPIDFDSELCTIPPPVREIARAALDRLTGSAAGHGVILSPVVQNFETVGECYLLGFTDPDTGREEWSIRSLDELRITDEGYFLTSSVQQTTSLDAGRRLPDDSYVARLWSPHPRFSEWADSPMRALLDTCEELLLAGRSRRAGLRNRIAGNGMLLMPNEIITGSAATATGTGDPVAYGNGDGVTDESDTGASKIMADLSAAMVAPIGDEAAPSAVVPLMLRGDAAALKEVRHLTLDRPMSKDADTTEEKALRRLATGLDVPPEIITGLADVNHWTAWQIDQATWTHHVEPIVASACAALTVGYLRSTLLTAGVGWEIVSRIVLWYDPSNLVEDPRAAEEVGETGRTPEELGSLSATAQTLILTGFDPAQVMAALDLPDLTFVGPPETSGGAFGQPRRVDSTREDQEPDQDTPPAIEAPPPAARAQAALERLAAGRAVVAAAAPPTPEQERLSRRLMEIDRSLRERLVGACDAALARVLERAGNRVRSAATRSATASAYRERIAGIPGQQVPAVLGRSVVAALGLDEAELLADEYARLRSQYVEWTTAASEDAITSSIRLLGKDTNSEEIRRMVGELRIAYREGVEAGWEFLQTGLGDVAERHLYDGDPDMPDRGEIPNALVNPSLVRGSLAKAGGLSTAIGGLTRDGLPGSRNIGVGGIGTGELLSDFMRGQGSEIDHYEWAYGISTRPFLPHQRLDGVRFGTWGAAELDTSGTGGEWIGSSFAPGDHKGCHCDYMPVWADGIRQRDVAEEIGDLAGGRATDAARDVAVLAGPRRRTVPPEVPYRGDDAPPPSPVAAKTKQARTRKPTKDEAGVPFRLTYNYLRKLTPEQHDNLVEHMSLRIADGDPLEVRRFEQYEQWEEYERAEFEHVSETFDYEPDVAEVRRVVDEFAARNGVPGLTHPRVGGRDLSRLGYDEKAGRAAGGLSKAAVQEEYAVWLEDLFITAETATRGHFRNPAGERRGVSLRELLAGPIAEVYRYASPELLEFLETNRRMTWTEFYYARTGAPAFAERAAKHAAENARINRDRTERGKEGRR